MKNSSEKEFSGEKTAFLVLLLDVPLSSRLVLEDLNLPAVEHCECVRNKCWISAAELLCPRAELGLWAVFIGSGLSCHPAQ